VVFALHYTPLSGELKREELPISISGFVVARGELSLFLLNVVAAPREILNKNEKYASREKMVLQNQRNN
jgi:hypothetical protein